MINRALAFQHGLTGDPFFVTLRRYFVFITGGFLGWATIALLYLFFNRVLGYNLFLAYAVGLVFADISTFIYHRYLTFNIRTNWKPRFIKFSVLVVLISVMNWALFSIIVGVLGITVPEISAGFHFGLGSGITVSPAIQVASDIIISFVITAFLSVVNFSVNRVFIFRRD